MTKKARLLLVALVMGLVPIPTLAGQQPAGAALSTDLGDADAQRLDRLLTSAVSSAGIVGLSTAVIVDGRIVWIRSYGMADRERSIALTPKTPMNLASIAKTTIGISMMRLVADGKLDLDADVNAYLPFRVVNPHHPDVKITLRQLATHTSSITDRRAFYASLYRSVDEQRIPLHDLLSAYLVPGGEDYRKENFLDAAPGASRDYSNLGATLAAYVVERIAGEPFDVHTTRVIFAPLALRTATWAGTDDDDFPRSRLYVQDQAGTRKIEPYALASYPDGGLQMSVEDLARYFAMLIGGGSYEGVRIIEPDALDEMKRFQWTAQSKPADHDLADGNSGLFWRTKFGGRRVGHGGNDKGVAAEMLTDAEGRVGIVLISNTSLYGDANLQIPAIIDALTAFGQAVAAESP